MAFEFESSKRRSSFRCRLDDGKFERCSSPQSYRVKRGKHSFFVFAVDAAGNRDETPAVHRFKLVKKR